MSARSIAPNVAQALLHAFNPIRSDWQRHCVNQRSNTDWLSDAVSNRNRMHAHSPLDTTCEVENSAGETQTRCRCSGKKDQVRFARGCRRHGPHRLRRDCWFYDCLHSSRWHPVNNGRNAARN